MEELKFKVGDKVRVKSLEWYNSEPKSDFGTIIRGVNFEETMSNFCSKEMTIKNVVKEKGHYYYNVKENIYGWQDWMLEDEPVNETHEVEQLNKTNMETKVMTKEQALEYLKDTKILCTSAKESRRVQEKLFAIGIKWHSGERTHGDVYLLFINNKKIEFTNVIESWIISAKKRIEPAEILAIQIKEEKPKFNPKDLKPFDKVLVRRCDKKVWKCSLFSHIDEEFKEYPFICTIGCWSYCIPYNEETKHLVGMKEEEPEFYKVWKK